MRTWKTPSGKCNKQSLTKANLLNILVGERKAAVLVSKIVSIDRFTVAGHLISYLGVFPEEKSSGVDREGNPCTLRERTNSWTTDVMKPECLNPNCHDSRPGRNVCPRSEFSSHALNATRVNTNRQRQVPSRDCTSFSVRMGVAYSY
ncbi:MAG: transposase [Pirellulaceae bacterium]